MRIAVFDTETTDLVPGQICQISYLLCEGDVAQGKNFFFTVDQMNERSQEIHGLSMEMLAEMSEGHRFEDDAAEIFEDFSGCKMIVGHNVSFDERFLRAEFSRCDMNLPRIAPFCTMNYFAATMNLVRKVNIGRPKPPRLEELVTYYALSPEMIVEFAAQAFAGGGAAHDARYDTAATYMCLREATRKGHVRGVLTGMS